MKSHVERRVIVEDTHRIPLRWLYLEELIRPGELTSGTLPGCGLLFRAWLTEGGTGGWIEICGHRWQIRSQPIVLQNRWWQDEHLFVQGRDGKLAKELLVTRDLTKVGTRGELGAHYRGQHVNTRIRTLKRRQRIFTTLLIVNQDPAASMNRTAFVPLDYHGDGMRERKPKGMWWATWWDKLRGRYHRDEPDIILEPVPRPCGITLLCFLKLLDRLNGHLVQAGRFRALVKAEGSAREGIPAATGHDRKGDVDGSQVIGWMERVFRRP